MSVFQLTAMYAEYCADCAHFNLVPVDYDEFAAHYE